MGGGKAGGDRKAHYGSEQTDAGTSNYSLSHELGSEWVIEQTNGLNTQAKQEISDLSEVNRWARGPILDCAEPTYDVKVG